MEVHIIIYRYRYIYIYIHVHIEQNFTVIFGKLVNIMVVSFAYLDYQIWMRNVIKKHSSKCQRKGVNIRRKDKEDVIHRLMK